MKTLFVIMTTLLLTACSQDPIMPDCFDEHQKRKILSIITNELQKASKELGYSSSQVLVKPQGYRKIDVNNVSGTVYCAMNFETQVGENKVDDWVLYYSIQQTSELHKYYYQWVLE